MAEKGAAERRLPGSTPHFAPSVPVVSVHQDERRKNAPRFHNMMHCIHEWYICHQNRHQTVSVFYFPFGLEPTLGSPERRKPFWGEEEQWNKRQITFALRINKSGLERYGTCDDEEAPNLASVTSSKFGRNSPGDCFVASAQSRSYLRNHQDGVCLRRLFSFTGLKATFILHINRHWKFRCLFYCQREKRIDLTIENMV